MNNQVCSICPICLSDMEISNDKPNQSLVGKCINDVNHRFLAYKNNYYYSAIRFKTITIEIIFAGNKSEVHCSSDKICELPRIETHELLSCFNSIIKLKAYI